MQENPTGIENKSELGIVLVIGSKSFDLSKVGISDGN